jgi:hypothetical protein
VGSEGAFDFDEVARELIDMGLSKEKRLKMRRDFPCQQSSATAAFLKDDKIRVDEDVTCRIVGFDSSQQANVVRRVARGGVLRQLLAITHA